MRKKRLFWRLYAWNFLIIFLALFAFTYTISISFKHILHEQVSADLEARAVLLKEETLRFIRNSDYAGLDRLCQVLGEKSRSRLTVTLSDGTVIADSKGSARSMDNHGTRPEILGALQGRTTTATRYSATLGQSAIYAATPVYDNGDVMAVIRTSVPLHRVESTVRSLQWKILAGGAIITLLAGVISLRISRRITRPIENMKLGARRFASGDLDFRLPVPEADEFSDLAEVMNTMAGQLQDRIGMIVQQHSEQDAVLSSMLEGVLAFDTDERLINVNKSAARMLKLSPDRALGRHIQEIIRNVGLQRFVERTLESGGPIEEFISVVGEQQERFLQAHGSLLRDQAGDVIGALVVLNDITELRKLETVRRDFVANVSHELKTPITSIKGFVETLLDGALHDKDDTLRFLGIISKQADRLNAIIEDLLSLSRIEQGTERDEIELAPGLLADVLSSAAQICQVEAAAKSMHILVDCPPSLSAMMNPQLLEQAVVNLVNNAIKYSDEGMRVWIEAEALNDDVVLIHVRDEGCGIEAEHLPRLFERFYRIDKARSRKMGGTGLGLAIVKHIVQAHHGRIDVVSSPGAGSNFSLHLHRRAGTGDTIAPNEVFEIRAGRL